MARSTSAFPLARFPAWRRISAAVLEDVARRSGTPTYLYQGDALRQNVRELAAAFAPVRPVICYALKANANLALVKIAAQAGCGADVVSGGELHVARRAGIPSGKIVFAGVGKTREEIRYALRERILQFNVESSEEAEAIHREASALRTRATVAVRINPDVDPESHHYISTGKKETKFGVPLSEAEGVIAAMSRWSGLRVSGLHMHIGSQITSTGPFTKALGRLLGLRDGLKRRGLPIDTLDIGGGVGIVYRRERPPTPAQYARAVVPALKRAGVRVILEPGRFLVGNAGILLTRVLYRKTSHGKRFVIVDAGMNDLIRPSLYEAYHEIIPVGSRSSLITRHSELVDVVGPVCESGDFFAKGRAMPPVRPGELVAIMSAGAYGYVMSSNYNMRPRPAEALWERGRWRLTRRRETHRDLLRGQLG